MNFHLSLTGYVGGPTFNAISVRKVLSQYPGKHVDILIDSFGGSLAEGLSICGAFRDHGDVTVHFRGMNASAATIASMGAKHIAIAPESMYLIHKVSMGFFDWAARNADQLSDFITLLSKTKDDLDAMDRSIAELYASRCKKPAKDMLRLMKDEKWISAEQAKEWGFVDEITAQVQPPGSTSITKAQANAFRALGLPLPPVDVEPDQKSFIAAVSDKVIQSIKQFLNPSQMDTPETQQPAQAATATPAPENVQLTPDSGHQAPENSDEKDQRIAELEAQIAEYKAKTPGATTAAVTASPARPAPQQPEASDKFSEFIKAQQEAQKLFNSIP